LTKRWKKSATDLILLGLVSFFRYEGIIIQRTFMPEPVIAQRSPFVTKVEPGTYWWCACGKSKGQPFCDGSHKGTGLGPQKVEITEPRTLAWCGCKHSKNGAFCDGSHGRLT
jgi:CDGSH-type Zn-finger protein